MKIKLGNKAKRALLFSDAVVHPFYFTAQECARKMVNWLRMSANVQGKSESLDAAKG